MTHSLSNPASLQPLSEGATPAEAAELLVTLFELGREVTSVLDLDELLEKIPKLIARLTPFKAFAVYLLDEKRQQLRIAYAVGYPEEVVRSFRLRVGEGIVGTAVAESHAIVVNDVQTDPRYVGTLDGVRLQLVVPLRRKKRVIGAMNLYAEQPAQFTARHEAMLRQFGAHVAVAIENARLFEREREYSAMLETLAEIAREFAAILELDQLLERVAALAHRVVDYRTFGIMLLDENAGVLEMRFAVGYGKHNGTPRMKLGEGITGHAALHKEVVYAPDVSKDPRYVRWVDDARSELAVPLLVKERCIGVLDLESPELDAFRKHDIEVLTLLATQVAVAIENAKLYEDIRANEERLEREVRFAQQVQTALLPAGPPRRMRAVDVAARFEPARELGGDLYDFLTPEANSLVVAVGDVSGKGVPAALYSVLAAELVRSRTFRRRYMPERFSPAGVLMSMNTILHERQLERYLCTLCYAYFDFKRRSVTLANSGLPYPLRSTPEGCQPLELPGVPLGSFAGVSYDQMAVDLREGDVFVFCTDGIYEAFDRGGREFGPGRVADIVQDRREQTADEIADAIFAAVDAHRGDGPRGDDMTAVVVKFLGQGS